MTAQYKTVTLGPSQVAQATRPSPGDLSIVPSVLVMQLSGLALVSGVDALLALREAVDFALNEPMENKDIAELLRVVTREMEIGGHRVLVANLPYTLTSDAGHALAHGKPFGACYWDTPNGRVFSLRSTEAGIDVAEVAQQYGGGGHKHAAGFRVPFDSPLGKA